MLGQGGDEIFGDALSEVVLIRVAAHVVER
jgi:hypothetical protein